MPFKVVVADGTFGSIENEQRVLRPIGAEVIFADVHTDEERIATCWDADAVTLERGPFRRLVIEKLQRCKMMVRYGVGYDEIDVEAATEHGIPVSNVPDYCVEEVADQALTLLLALARRLIPAHNAAVNGLKDWTFRSFRTIERLRGKTAGIVGLGRIGCAFAQRAKALGLSVLTCDPYIQPQAAQDVGAELVSLEELMERSDFISIHVPLNDETRHLIGVAQLQRMKPTAYLINTARGSVVDQKALTKALESGKIAGVGLDVLEDEPPTPQTRQRLLKLPNVVITPHMGWYSEQAMVDRQIKAAQTIAIALQGGRPPTVVNPRVYESR